MPVQDSKRNEQHQFSDLLRNNGLLLTCLALFGVFFVGMILSGSAT